MFGFSFSLNRLLGVTAVKNKFARRTGVPTNKGGIERKVGRSLINLFFKK